MLQPVKRTGGYFDRLQERSVNERDCPLGSLVNILIPVRAKTEKPSFKEEGLRLGDISAPPLTLPRRA
jgi:hypothetical protein